MKTLGEAQGAGPSFGKKLGKGGENLEKMLENSWDIIFLQKFIGLRDVFYRNPPNISW
jgi:hypothetical protein